MKWNILHESRGRIRLHLNKPRLSMAEADQLQAYLADLPGVRVAVVYERTCDAVITYTGARTDVLHGAAAFQNSNAGIGSPQINADNFTHNCILLFLSFKLFFIILRL